MATGTRDRIVQSSAELFRRQGFTGTGVKQIVAEASAPFGSLYHFFPGGKEELGAEVVRWSGGLYGQLMGIFFTPGADPVKATRAAFASAAETLAETDYADACPIATVALETSSVSEPMRQACADVFTGWIEGFTRLLMQYGLTRKRARTMSISILNALEGAFVLSRALRSTEPLEVAGEACAAQMRAALPTGRPTRGSRAARKD